MAKTSTERTPPGKATSRVRSAPADEKAKTAGTKDAGSRTAATKTAATKTAATKTAAGKRVASKKAVSTKAPVMSAAPKRASASVKPVTAPKKALTQGKTRTAKTSTAPVSKVARRAATARKSVVVKAAAPRRPVARKAAAIPAARPSRPSPVVRTAPAPAATSKLGARAAQAFAVSHLNEADFVADGPRAYASYRDLGMAAATNGLCQAHVIRLVPPCTDAVRKRHVHQAELQLVYVLKGWMKNEFEGHGEQMMSAGSCWLQPPNIKHTVLDYSADCEVLEIIVPADFKTEELA